MQVDPDIEKIIQVLIDILEEQEEVQITYVLEEA